MKIHGMAEPLVLHASRHDFCRYRGGRLTGRGDEEIFQIWEILQETDACTRPGEVGVILG
ncbi:MAG: hypothetical protein D6795_09535 [Deltaproteobacteria bacterium]|nr:MAG: hypothetical protein D6795_09535 [Deltaproteobacteria bacterium]